MGIENQDDILVLIARNLAGLADSIEMDQLKEWIESSADNNKYFEQVRNIWDATDKKIDPGIINLTAAREKVLGRIAEVHAGRSFWYYWQKIAAVLIFPLAIGALLWVYFNSKNAVSSNEIVYNEVFAAFGTRSSLRLADSTLVWLNSGSSLRYPNRFNGKDRLVFLKGEAYFEVEGDILKPFIVRTPALEVKATGTKFNVQEYDSNPVTEVTLVSGKILVSESDDNKNTHLISELNPDQHLTYNRQTKEISINNEDAYRFVAWKDGKLIFRHEPLDKVLNRISMIFNVDIELQGKELRDYRYHATFQDESLEEILKLLRISAPIGFKEVSRNPLNDGSFLKKKIIIFPARQIIHNKPE